MGRGSWWQQVCYTKLKITVIVAVLGTCQILNIVDCGESFDDCTVLLCFTVLDVM